MGRDTRAIAKAGVRPTAGVYQGPKRAVTALLLVSVTVHRPFPGARAVPVEEPRAAIGLGGERDGGVRVEAALHPASHAMPAGLLVSVSLPPSVGQAMVLLVDLGTTWPAAAQDVA